MNAELQERLWSLEAERLRPTPPKPPSSPSELAALIESRIDELVVMALEDDDRPSPPDPATFLETLRFGPNAPTCLIEGAVGMNPPQTLCGINLFADSMRGWSIRGRYTSPAWVYAPCAGCVEAARRDWPGLPVVGVFPLSEPFAVALGVQALDHPSLPDPAPQDHEEAS